MGALKFCLTIVLPILLLITIVRLNQEEAERNERRLPLLPQQLLLDGYVDNWSLHGQLQTTIHTGDK